MRRKDILEGPLKNFQQNIAKGFQATQKGGWLAPDSLEKGIQKFFTQVDEPDKDKDKNAAKGGKGTGDALDKKQPEQPKAAEPKAAEPTKKDDFPTGVSKGNFVKVKPGDAVEYKNAEGKTKDGEVVKLLDTRDKQGDLQIQLKKRGAVFAIDRQNIKKVNGQDWEYKLDTDTGKTKEETMSKAIKEGLADLADMAERDHEVQMARADLYKIAKYAIKLHDMMKNVSEAEGLEGWQQAKITKAADYIGSVYHNLEYDLKFADGGEMPADALAGISESKKDTHCSDKCCGAEVKREDCKCPPDCEHCNCNDPKVDEGKSPHAKGTKKYKKHMAAMHAEGVQDTYKLKIAERLNKKLGK